MIALTSRDAAFLGANPAFYWGDFTGTISNQADLWAELSALPKKYSLYVDYTAPADTNENQIFTAVIAGGSLKDTGQLKISAQIQVTNNANAKTIRAYYGGSLFQSIVLGTGHLAGEAQFEFFNTTASSQKFLANRLTPFGDGGSDLVAGLGSMAVNSAIDQTLVITCQKANGADACQIFGVLIELTPS